MEILFVIPAFSLAGIPPLSGFFAKFSLILAGLEIKQYLVVAVAMMVGIMTLFSMMKIWSEAFWKAPPATDADLHFPDKHPLPLAQLTPIIFLALLTTLIGFMAEPFFQVASQAARQILNPGEYIYHVLGVR